MLMEKGPLKTRICLATFQTLFKQSDQSQFCGRMWKGENAVLNF